MNGMHSLGLDQAVVPRDTPLLPLSSSELSKWKGFVHIREFIFSFEK